MYCYDNGASGLKGQICIVEILLSWVYPVDEESGPFQEMFFAGL